MLFTYISFTPNLYTLDLIYYQIHKFMHLEYFKKHKIFEQFEQFIDEIVLNI